MDKTSTDTSHTTRPRKTVARFCNQPRLNLAATLMSMISPIGQGPYVSYAPYNNSSKD
jgi:hypothetical protein